MSYTVLIFFQKNCTFDILHQYFNVKYQPTMSVIILPQEISEALAKGVDLKCVASQLIGKIQCKAETLDEVFDYLESKDQSKLVIWNRVYACTFLIWMLKYHFKTYVEWAIYDKRIMNSVELFPVNNVGYVGNAFARGTDVYLLKNIHDIIFDLLNALLHENLSLRNLWSISYENAFKVKNSARLQYLYSIFEDHERIDNTDAFVDICIFSASLKRDGEYFIEMHPTYILKPGMLKYASNIKVIRHYLDGGYEMRKSDIISMLKYSNKPEILELLESYLPHILSMETNPDELIDFILRYAIYNDFNDLLCHTLDFVGTSFDLNQGVLHKVIDDWVGPKASLANLAISYGNYDMAMKLFSHGADPNYKSEELVNSLMSMTQKNMEHIVEPILSLITITDTIQAVCMDRFITELYQYGVDKIKFLAKIGCDLDQEFFDKIKLKLSGEMIDAYREYSTHVII
jgi:hypothetical protein